MGLSITVTYKEEKEPVMLEEGLDGVADLAVETRSDPQFIIIGAKYDDGSMSNIFIDRMSVMSLELFTDEAPDGDDGDEADDEDDAPSHLKLVH